MKSRLTPAGTWFLAATWLAMAGLPAADPRPATAEGKPGATEAQALLEQGRASGSWPAGLVIRLGACLGGPEGNTASGEGLPAVRVEQWEFASNQVRRIGIEADADDGSGPRVESRPFDGRGLCQDLLDGKAVEIQARKGQGREIGFVGTRYDSGTRSIEVLWEGRIILSLFETNGPTLALYRESDARAFGALYERLASQARSAFPSGAAEAK